MRARLALVGFLWCAWAAADQTVAVGPGIAFSPPSVTVAPGEKVTWVWAGVYHSSTSDESTGPEVWNSGIISTGTFEHVFTTPGTYHYYCMVHSFPGGTFMNGVVEVTGVATATPTATETPEPTVTPTSPPGTPLPTATPLPVSAVPTLGPAGELALVFGLVALALFLLLRRS
jgi:plastocyanin